MYSVIRKFAYQLKTWKNFCDKFFNIMFIRHRKINSSAQNSKCLCMNWRNNLTFQRKEKFINGFTIIYQHRPSLKTRSPGQSNSTMVQKNVSSWNRCWNQKHIIHDGLNRCRCHSTIDFISSGHVSYRTRILEKKTVKFCLTVEKYVKRAIEK